MKSSSCALYRSARFEDSHREAKLLEMMTPSSCFDVWGEMATVTSDILASFAHVDPPHPTPSGCTPGPGADTVKAGESPFRSMKLTPHPVCCQFWAARQQYTKPVTPKRGGVFSPVVAISPSTPLTDAAAQSRLNP